MSEMRARALFLIKIPKHLAVSGFLFIFVGKLTENKFIMKRLLLFLLGIIVSVTIVNAGKVTSGDESFWRDGVC